MRPQGLTSEPLGVESRRPRPSDGPLGAADLVDQTFLSLSEIPISQSDWKFATQPFGTLVPSEGVYIIRTLGNTLRIYLPANLAGGVIVSPTESGSWLRDYTAWVEEEKKSRFSGVRCHAVRPQRHRSARQSARRGCLNRPFRPAHGPVRATCPPGPEGQSRCRSGSGQGCLWQTDRG